MRLRRGFFVYHRKMKVSRENFLHRSFGKCQKHVAQFPNNFIKIKVILHIETDICIRTISETYTFQNLIVYSVINLTIMNVQNV